MKTSLNNLKQRIASFDQDERGMETLQAVLIIAIAAMILALVVNQWGSISSWAVKTLNSVMGTDTTTADQAKGF